LLYFPDRERHYLKAEDAGELRFLELYVPGEFKTVWADKTKASVWRSTGLDINDRETELDERRDAFGHILGNPLSADEIYPAPHARQKAIRQGDMAVPFFNSKILR
jgi:hypothetical protein